MADNTKSMPARGHSTAPSFHTSQPRELRRYFEQLDYNFRKCNVNTDPEKKQFARLYVDIDTSDLWGAIPEHADAIKYEDFVKAVYKLYPGAEDECMWSISDMDKLVSEQLRLGIHNANELGTYYRAFFTITQFLRKKERLSEAEQSRAFVRGFQSELWDKIKQRLDVKFQDHYPDDPYPLQGVHDAAQHVLHGTLPIPVQLRDTTSTTTQSPAPASTVKTEDIVTILDKFALILLKALTPQVTQQSSHTSSGQQSNRPNCCNFCGVREHYMRDCALIAKYMQDGKIKRNSDGKIILSTGAFIPRTIEGQWMKDRVDEWHRLNPNQLAMGMLSSNASPSTEQLMYEIHSASAPSTSGASTSRSTFQLSKDDKIAMLEYELNALRQKTTFDGVEIPVRKKPARDPPVGPANQPAPQPAKEKAANPPATSKPVEPPVHPFVKAGEPHYRPPHDRNFAGVNKPNKEKDFAYRTCPPIHDVKIAEEVYNRSMNNPIVTLTQKELLSLSPKIRQKMRDEITPRRVPPGIREAKMHDIFDEEIFLCEDQRDESEPIIIPDFYEQYLKSLAPGEQPDPNIIIVAKDSHALRSIHMVVNNQEKVECIVDPGCQIIAMSEAVCHDLGLAYDPSIRLNMQSANGELDKSLGLAHNVPCRIADITLFLQVHVIRSPAYDILVGRPFDVLTESVVKNYANEDQTITICDPNSGRCATIPTVPRGPPKHHSVPPPHPTIKNTATDFHDLRG